MIQFCVYISEAVFFQQSVRSVFLPLTEGVLEILPGHAPLVQVIAKGVIILITPQKESVHISVEDGVCLISQESLDVFTSYATLGGVNMTDEEQKI